MNNHEENSSGFSFSRQVLPSTGNETGEKFLCHQKKNSECGFDYKSSFEREENYELFENIKSSAYLKKLHCFTVPILLKFCKQNNIKVKSKEKKKILIDKIHHFFFLVN